MHIKALIRDFQPGDVVSSHGARFRVIETVRTYDREGEPGGAVWAVNADWIDGAEAAGYFGPGVSRPWTFQGNMWAGLFNVERN